VKCRGKDSNAIDLHICSPKKDQPFIPHTSRTCILHVHGGGMSVLSTMDPIYRATRLRLAEMGFTVIGVEFRNAAGRLGPHRFPAGLNDCLSALDFVYANKKKINIDKIMLLGESGGANLSLAMALQASQNNMHHMIDGVYALCPYIYGDYNIASKDKDGSLPSLIENDGLLLPRCEAMHIMSDLYLPDGELPSENPLAWPYHASIEMMEGLPPHVISVNELDPCRDEGLEYCEKLVTAGVVARSRVVKGTCHAGELLFMKYIPDIFASTLNDVNDFAKKLI
jgi:acetyl esterase